jgi:hypothetical protein
MACETSLFNLCKNGSEDGLSKLVEGDTICFRNPLKNDDVAGRKIAGDAKVIRYGSRRD